MSGPARGVLLLAGRLDASEARRIRGLVGRLADRRFAAWPLCVSGGAGWDVRECPGLGSPWRRTWDARRLKMDDPTGRPDLIHVLGVAMAEAGLALADRWRVPYLLTVEEFLPPGAKIRAGRRWCRGLIAGGEELADDLRAHLGVPPSWIEVVPPGVELPERPCPGSRGAVKVVGAAGPMTAGSGLATFLGAACRVVNAGVDAEFVVAGQGRDEADLRRRADRLGIAGRVTFVGDPAGDAAIWDVLDVYCQPAHGPDAGRRMATALAHALPVLASDVAGLRALADGGDAARLLPPGDADALAVAILDLLDDPDAARDLGRRGRAAVARRLDPGREADRLADLYVRALEPPHPGDPAPACGLHAAGRLAIRHS